MDRGPHGPGTAVDHRPQAAVGVGLEFEEVVAAAEGRELHAAVARGHRRERWGRERVESSGGGSALATPARRGARRHRAARPSRTARATDDSRSGAAARRTPPRPSRSRCRGRPRRGRRGRGAGHHADAHAVGQVDVGDDRDALDTGRSREEVEGAAHLARQRPASQVRTGARGRSALMPASLARTRTRGRGHAGGGGPPRVPRAAGAGRLEPREAGRGDRRGRTARRRPGAATRRARARRRRRGRKGAPRRPRGRRARGSGGGPPDRRAIGRVRAVGGRRDEEDGDRPRCRDAGRRRAGRFRRRPRSGRDIDLSTGPTLEEGERGSAGKTPQEN